MRTSFVRTLVLSAVLLAPLTACLGADEAGEEKLELLTIGMSADSMFKVLPQGPITGEGADTARVRNGYRLSRYFVSGQMYTVLYVRDLPGNVKELVEQNRETPIVLDGANKVVGWGWKYYAEEAIPKLGLPTPLIDTTTVPQPAAPGAAPGAADSTKKSDSVKTAAQ
jgi:hypothetical protein